MLALSVRGEFDIEGKATRELPLFHVEDTGEFCELVRKCMPVT